VGTKKLIDNVWRSLFGKSDPLGGGRRLRKSQILANEDKPTTDEKRLYSSIGAPGKNGFLGAGKSQLKSGTVPALTFARETQGNRVGHKAETGHLGSEVVARFPHNRPKEKSERAPKEQQSFLQKAPRIGPRLTSNTEISNEARSGQGQTPGRPRTKRVRKPSVRNRNANEELLWVSHSKRRQWPQSSKRTQTRRPKPWRGLIRIK